MSDTQTNNNGNGIAPTSPDGRIFGTLSYILMWWSALTVIQIFALGQGLLPPIGRLNITQAFMVMITAGAVFVVALSLNGRAGLKYGIPFSIQTRTSFGVRGSTIAEFLRALPALIWYGIGSWIAALAIDGILKQAVGFSTPVSKYVWFVALQVIQTFLAYRGIKMVKAFSVVGSVIIVFVKIYLLVHVLATYGFHVKSSWTTTGTWGAPFWEGLTSSIGVLAAVALNISDITRHLVRSERANWLGHLLGVLPPWFFMLFLGMAASLALGIWDPVEAFMQLSPNRFVMFVLLVLILVAQITTNLTINIMPPALVFVSTFRMSWGKGVLLTSVLGTLTFPWLLMANSKAFFGFILYYSAFFGPILGVMLADYYVVRRGELEVAELYIDGPDSPYWYNGGFNIAGLLAVFIPGIITMIWCLSVSWLIGVPAGFVLYLLLRRLSIDVSQRLARPVVSAE
jgi:nucleobase:cation symporter-1, NCS1 family